MLNKDVKSVEKGLLNQNYTRVLQGLWEIGRPIKQAWDVQLKQETGKISEKYRFSSHKPFKEFLVDRLKSYKKQAIQTNTQTDTQANQSAIQELNSKLANLALFITVWNDREDNKENTDDNDVNSLETSASQPSTPNKKWLHQQIKYKSTVDKNNRYAINIALQVLVIKLCQQSEQFIKNKQGFENFKELNKHDLRNLILSRIESLNNLLVPGLQKEIEKITPILQKEIENIEKVIKPLYSINLAALQEEEEEVKKATQALQEEIKRIGTSINNLQAPNLTARALQEGIEEIARSIKALHTINLPTAALQEDVKKATQALQEGIEKIGTSINVLQTLNLPDQILQAEINKIGKAIVAFQTPDWKRYFLKIFGVSLAVIASLACGFATGGAIYLLFPNLPILAFCLGGVIGLWGFSANFGFFSQNFPEFLLSLFKKGGISEYIDPEGNRQQLSPIKKYLFIPLAALASFTVGVGTAALTYTTLIALVVKLLPILAIIWPPLPLIIVGILSAAIGITLTVAVFTATIGAIKNSQNFSWQHFKEKLSSLTTREIIGYLFKGLIVLVGLFGLAYFRYTAGIDLTKLLTPLTGSAAMIISAIVGAIAYIPQGFFTVVSIQKLIRVFSPASNPSQQATLVNEPPKSFLSRVRSGVSTLYTWVALTGNALGNAALVLVDGISAFSISGAVGGFFNSLSGNLIEPDRNLFYRNQANAALAKDFKSPFTQAEKTTAPKSPETPEKVPQASTIRDKLKLEPQEETSEDASTIGNKLKSKIHITRTTSEDGTAGYSVAADSSITKQDPQHPVPANSSRVATNSCLTKGGMFRVSESEEASNDLAAMQQGNLKTI